MEYDDMQTTKSDILVGVSTVSNPRRLLIITLLSRSIHDEHTFHSLYTDSDIVILTIVMAEENTESRNQARLAILELANMISVPMSLNAVVLLNVPDAIWQGGSNTPLSASQILTCVLPSGGDPENLQRILRMLTTYGVFAEHLNSATAERKYSLTDVGKTLVTDSHGLSYAPYVLQHHQVYIFIGWIWKSLLITFHFFISFYFPSRN